MTRTPFAVPTAMLALILACATLLHAQAADDPADYSWRQQHARVLPTGDLQWDPRPFVYTAGESVRYIDFDAGQDANPGSREAPWKHHPWDPEATATAKAAAGIHTYVFKRGVVYRGALYPDDHGEPGNPIRLTSDPTWGEGDAVISGAEILSDWRPGMPHADIPGQDELALETVGYHIDLDYQPRTLWMIDDDGAVTRIPIARSPNWTVSNPDDIKSEWYQWDFGKRKHFGHTISPDGKRQLHLAYDVKNITKPKAYYDGATIWSEWGWVMGTPYAAPVEYVDTAGQALGFSGIWGGPSGQVIGGNRYYLEDKPHYLDAPGEYWVERRGTGSRVYLRLPGDRDPRQVRVEAGKRIHMLDATELRHVAITGLTFRFANLIWNQAAGPWAGPDVSPAAVRLRGSGQDIRIAHCRFEHLHMAVSMRAGGETDRIDQVAVTDCRISHTDHGAVELRDGGAWGQKNPDIGRLYHVDLLRNKLDHIGMRPHRFGQGHAMEVDCAETSEIAGNILDRCYGSGIFVWGAKRSVSAADRPLSRILIHHNKVTNSMLNTNDWGGIETWQGGPAYVYNNISGNPGGYWHYNYLRNPANARFGHAYYLDGAYKNYLFNNIAWGKSNDQTSPLANTAAFQEIHSFQNTFFNNTAYNFVVGSRRQAPRAGRDKFLGNIWQDISRRAFRHADPAKGPAEANADHAGAQGDEFALHTNAYAANLFHQVGELGVLDSKGRILATFADFQQALQAYGAISAELGQLVDTAPIPHAAEHDFRPAPGSAVVDAGVRVFVPWALHATVGEWHFYADTTGSHTILDEHWYMTPYYTDREHYPDMPTFPLQTVNIPADAYTDGPLEDWTRGALTLNGRDQYAVLRQQTLEPIAETPEPPPRESFAWVQADVPAQARADEPFQVVLTLNGVPDGQTLHADLHMMKAGGAFGGVAAVGKAQDVKGAGPYTISLTPKARSGIDSYVVTAYTSTDGSWKTRQAVARFPMLAAHGAEITAADLKSPQIRRTNHLIELYVRADRADAILVQKQDAAAGYRLDLDADGKPRFQLMAGGKTWQVIAPTAITDGDWHHLVAEADRSAKALRLYLDGKPVAQAEGPDGSVDLSNSADLVVGGSPDGRCLLGAIDFLRIAQGTIADAKTSIAELHAWQFHGPQLRDFTGRTPTGARRDAGAIEAE